MSGYLISIIGTVLVCAVLTAILPSGKTAGVIKGIAKLACVIAIISPIPQFLGEWGVRDKKNEKNTEKISQSVIQTDESFIKYYCEARISNAEDALNKEILEKFSLAVTSDISWEFADGVCDVDSIIITKIAIKTDENTSKERKNAVKTYIVDNYGSEVQIE